jgi:hypothetical protein
VIKEQEIEEQETKEIKDQRIVQNVEELLLFSSLLSHHAVFLLVLPNVPPVPEISRAARPLTI